MQQRHPEDILQGRDRGGMAQLSPDTLGAATGVSAAFAQKFGPNLDVMIGIARTVANEVELSNARNKAASMAARAIFPMGPPLAGN